MPDKEAPEAPEPASPRISIIESIPSESDSLTLSDYEFEVSVANSVEVIDAESSSDGELSLLTLPLPFVACDLPELDLERIEMPLEHDLRQLLIKVTAPQDLSTVTSIRLRVIARDFSLQRLPIYLPRLRELCLDGSCLATLRDLGCGLQSLAILHVCRTGLNSLDGLFGLSGLVEFYASHNNIRNLSPCSALSNVEVLDLAYNVINDVNSVSFLSLCTNLKHIKLEGNSTTDVENYRDIIKELLPDIISLDDEYYSESVQDRSIAEKSDEKHSLKIISRFPPIHLQRDLQKEAKDIVTKLNKRPHTTGSFEVTKENKKMLPFRPATARKATTDDFGCIINGSDLKLKDIKNLFIPSRLTTGKPITGNLALSLWERKTAWENSKNKTHN